MNEDLSRDFGRMEGKIDAFMSELRNWRLGIETKQGDHEERIAALERVEQERRGALKAARYAWAALAALGGLASATLGRLLGIAQ